MSCAGKILSEFFRTGHLSALLHGQKIENSTEYAHLTVICQIDYWSFFSPNCIRYTMAANISPMGWAMRRSAM